MKTLRIDIETYSSVDLIKCGVYKYVDSDDFEILLFGYAFDNEPVQVVDLVSFEAIPEDVHQALTDSNVIKTAYNANFERTCLTKHTREYMDPSQWRCTAVHGSYLGLPGNLDGIAKVLKLDVQKDTTGKNLIKYFSMPCKPTKVNGGRTRNYPHHDPEKWEKYKTYNRIDVEVERELSKKLSRFPFPEQEQRLWELDQRMNDGGVKVDQSLVAQAIICDAEIKDILLQELKDLTGLDNPNSGPQLKRWIQDREGIEVDSLAKEALKVLLTDVKDKAVIEALKLKQQISKTSVKKYQAMERMMCSDEHVKGILQFYGANRSGRWAGRGVQMQNLPRNYLKDIELARNLVLEGDLEFVHLLFGNVPDTLSQLIRTAFIPESGERFCIADFSAIEARILAWLAKELWRLKVFSTHGKIYEASASQMFNVPIEKIKKGNPEYKLRAKGKVAELALGYGGSVGALIGMGALRDGLKEDELKPLVDVWRKANPKITKLWWSFDKAALETVKDRKARRVGPFVIRMENSFMTTELPSGRKLFYYRPEIYTNKFGRDAIRYWDLDQDTKKWGKVGTYGPTLVQNCCQAIARDCLGIALTRLEKAGYDVKFHVHDEVIVSHPKKEDCIEDIKNIMAQPIEWAEGLDLPADAFYSDFYMKEKD